MFRYSYFLYDGRPEESTSCLEVPGQENDDFLHEINSEPKFANMAIDLEVQNFEWGDTFRAPR